MEPSVKLCMGCMNELGADGHCHYCSYTDDIPHLQAYLAPRTVLDNRYVIGKMLSYNGEGASYICYDMVGKCKCVCREYMPDTLCERAPDGLTLNVNRDCLAKYKTFMSEFADMNKVLSRMRNLTHIVTAKDMFAENNTTYVILEYVEGVSLKKFLQSNKGFLTWEQVKKLFVPLFTTLNIIHNAGIIHRGISPENIIVTTDGELKLTGFCISSIRTSNTGMMPEFYSGYTAPEQYSSLQWQGTWTDVYAVAAVIYRILTGNMPLDANTRIHNDTLMEASRINPRIPLHISDALAQAMAVRGEERTQTVTELVSGLFEQPSRIEHPKGSTQTIPIQHVPREERRYRDEEDEEEEYQRRRPAAKKSSKLATIVGLCVLGVLLVIGIYLMTQLFAPPDTNSTAVSRAPEEEISDSEAEDSYDYGTATTTTAAKSDDDDTEYGRGSIMPNLVGLYYTEVEKKMGDEFTLKPKYYYSDDVDRGYVKSQSIPEGTDYDPKRKNELVLEVCAGPSVIPVPDCSNYSKSDYLSLLDSLNIKYSVAEDYSKSVPYGLVFKTSIPAGGWINIEEGDILTVTVSLGRPPETTTKSSTSVSGGTTEPQLSVDTQDPWAPHTDPPVSSGNPGNTDQPEITDNQNGGDDNNGGVVFY
ncbi:MAG: PASTA domain-containing protein [Ruminococcus sp.]|uniref:protein kinase domain-containing protein n=1 Tax=Ruminococcus sp. TaxID=41978 RepID=UPI0025DFFF72|nr:PASTA domain-containing protein [Ruminococcus sp.]MBO4866685.1 PASTA domain-containing protein [Ruminococcus sp.]